MISKRHKREYWLNRRRAKIIRERKKKRLRIREWRMRKKTLRVDDYIKDNVSNLRKGVTISLPEFLDFEQNYEQTCSYFNAIRKAACDPRYKFKKLHFNKLERISPSAALVLASEVDVWKMTIGQKLKADVGTWNQDIKRLLCQMGYFELLKLPPQKFEPEKNTVFIRFRKARIKAQEGSEVAIEIRKEIERITAQGIERQYLFHGISEAITNVGHHAYSGRERFPYWWISASYDREASLLKVVFYDQGVGIPNTLKNSHVYEYIKDVFGAMKDAARISAALTAGRTSTMKPERGKGLQNLLEFAQCHPEGRVRIYSGRGMAEVEFFGEGHEKKQRREQKDFLKSIGGTLIEWSVKLFINENH